MTRRRAALFAVAAVLVVLFGGRWLALRYTDALWFEDLGHGARWRGLLLRSLGWQLATLAVAFLWFAAHTVGVYFSIGAVHLPRRLGNLEIDEAVPARILRAIALGTAAVLAAATTYTFADIDQYLALARVAAPFGLKDPILARDASFYLGVLPLYEVLHLFATVLAVLAALLVIALYAVTGSFAISRRRVRITPHARTHLVVLLTALALVVAWGFQIDAWQMIAGGGHLGGALSPTDRAIRIPASHALAALALAVAVGSVLALKWLRPALLFGLWATLGVATLLGRLIIPVMTEAWGTPAEPAEVAQIARWTEDYSRRAFGVFDMPVRHFAAGELHPDSAASLAAALEGVYAWSGQPELPGWMLDRIERDTLALNLWSVSPAEAREPGGALVPAALAVPQIDMLRAARVVSRPSWTPLHRGAYAWGGSVVALGASLRGGTPRFFGSLDPADSAVPGTRLAAAPARVRFLPHGAELGIVGPDEGTTADPAPGIQLSHIFRRLMLAWALQSPPLLDEHTSNADRVLYWRDIPSRLSRLYPFAGFDPARGAMVDGRLLWIVDGYLMSARFPLAEPVGWRGDLVNYLASPYVVTVDAVSGATRFYLRSGANAFEASIPRSVRLEPLPAESLPPGVVAALRYPEALLGGQAGLLAHRGEGVDSGDRLRRWSLAWPDTSTASHDAALIQPTIALAAPTGGARRPWQFVPLTDDRGSHLVAMAAGTSNPSGKLELLLIRLEGTTLPTPRTAEARMAGSPAWIAASNAVSDYPVGSAERETHKGPVLVIPAAGTIAYAQLLFRTGRLTDPVRITGVGVLAGNRTGFGVDARSAARSVVRGDGEAVGIAIAGAELTEARAAFQALDSARAAGDWDRFGQAWANLRRALRLDPVLPPGGARPFGPRRP